MRQCVLCFILIFVSLATWSANPALIVLNQPIAKFIVASYFASDSEKPLALSQKAQFFVNQLEYSMLDATPPIVSSLAEYIQLRNRSVDSLPAYWADIQKNGLINPLNIKAINTNVFEKILEYEIREIDSLMAQVPASSRSGSWFAIANRLISIYKSGLGARDRLDESTRSWEGVPVLGFFRAMGENVVNPLVRKVLYSETVLNRMRSQMRTQIASVRSRIHTDFHNAVGVVSTTGLAELDKILAQSIAKIDVLKPFLNLDAALVARLAFSFFNSLPKAVQADLAWLLVNKPGMAAELIESPNSIMDLLSQRHPHSTIILDHFLNWIDRPEVVTELQKISELPLRSLAKSFAIIQRNQVVALEDNGPPRLLADSRQRNWFGGIDGRFQFYLLSPSQARQPIPRSYSLDEYIAKFPGSADFLKRQIAAITLHNAFSSGLQTVLSNQVRVLQMAESKTMSVYLAPLGPRDAHPLDSSERFIGSTAQLPWRELMSATGSELADWFQNLQDGKKESIKDFMSDPDNLRWAIQMLQLQSTVGPDIFRSEIKKYILKNPKLVVTFVKKRWFSKPSLNLCPLFYR